MQIANVMRKPVKMVTCRPADPVRRAAQAMDEYGVGCVLVTDQGVLCGILTDRDIAVSVVAPGKSPTETQVGEIMQRHVVSAGPDLDVSEAAHLMARHHIRRLPIQWPDGTIEGVVSVADLAPFIGREMDALLAIEAAVDRVH